MLGAVGARPTKRFAQIDSTVVSVSPANTNWTIRTLEQDPRVAYAEPNFILHAADTPNDPSFPQEWGLNNTGQQVNFTTGTPDADIDAKEAWSVSTGSPNVTVAVIDTGVDVTHPDLAQNIWINEGENCAGCRTNGIDDDGDGYVDDWRGWDFVNHDNNPTDDNGHGTHVAGTIAAAGNNGIGVTGVTWNSTIMPLKFLDSSGSGSTEDAISAILYARAKGVPIMNNSWGGGDFSQALEDAIELTDASGELFVAAAGNDFTNTDADAVLAVELRHAEHHLRRRERPVRPQGLVLELRRAHGRPLRAGHEHLLDLEGLDLPLRGRHVDGRPARLGSGRARQGGVPERERRRPQGASPAHGRPDCRPQRRQQDCGSPQRRPRRPLHRDRRPGSSRRATASS